MTELCTGRNNMTLNQLKLKHTNYFLSHPPLGTEMFSHPSVPPRPTYHSRITAVVHFCPACCIPFEAPYAPPGT